VVHDEHCLKKLGSLGFTNSTTEFAARARRGGSKRAAPWKPTIKVVTLESPFSLEEWRCVWNWAAIAVI
jgi:hypothetical protein